MAGVITDIRRLKRRGEYAVFVDGMRAFDVDAEVLFTLGLHEGEPIDDTTAAKARSDTALKRAKGRALRLLGVRARSTHELSARLRQGGFDCMVTGEVVAWLQSLGYLDDRRFARDWIEARINERPMGRIRLSQELDRKGISPGIAEEVLEGLDGERELALAMRAASRRISRYTNLPPQEAKKKLFGFLQRRGFHYGTIRKTISQLLPEG